MYTHKHAHTFTHMYLHTYLHTQTHACMHAYYVHAYIFTYVCGSVLRHIHAYIHIHNTYRHTYILTHIHIFTYILAYTHTYTHTYMLKCTHWHTYICPCTSTHRSIDKIPELLLMTEEAVAPRSSTLAWKIPWAEEPGRLQSMGSLRVGQDWVTSLSLFTLHWRRKWQPTPVFLPGESQGRGSLVSCHLWGCRVGHDWNNLAAAAAPNEMRDICGFLGEPWERRPQGLRRGERELLIMIIIILTI